MSLALLPLLLMLAGCTSYEPRTWSAVGGSGGPGGTYRVRSGDTVNTIAASYGVSSSRLIAVNGLSNPDHIQVGQLLRLPGGSPTAVRTSVARSQAMPVSPASRPSFATPATVTAPQRMTTVAALPATRPTTVAKPAEQLASAAPAEKPSLPATAKAAAPSAMPPASRDAMRKAAVAKPPALSGEGFMWPVNGKVVQTFGPKQNGQRNDGINISVPAGTPVVAAENGIVVFAGDSIAGFGNMLLIRHASGFTTAYAHNDSLLVSTGQRVKRGQVIARAGSTGAVTASQVHFELRAGRKALDPATQLTDLPPSQLASR